MKVSLVTTFVLSTVAAIPTSAFAQISAGVQVQVNAPPPPTVTVQAPVVVAAPPPVYYAPESEPEVEVVQAPPPVQAEAIPPMPAPGFVWRRGYWRWAGNQYLWIGGHWERPPQAGYGWVEPRWEMRGGRWRFRRGRWGAGVAAPVYAPAPAPAVVVAPQPVYAPPPPVVVAPQPGPYYGRRGRGGVVVVQPPTPGVIVGPRGGAVFVGPRGRWRR